MASRDLPKSRSVDEKERMLQAIDDLLESFNGLRDSNTTLRQTVGALRKRIREVEAACERREIRAEKEKKHLRELLKLSLLLLAVVGGGEVVVRFLGM